MCLTQQKYGGFFFLFFSSFRKLGIVDIAAGSLHTLALSNAGSIYSFGQGLEGQLGNGKEDEMVLDPTVSHIIPPFFGFHFPVSKTKKTTKKTGNQGI